MIFGKTDVKKRLEVARSDLAAAETNQVLVAGAEDAASVTTESYAAWRKDRDNAASEIARLLKLISALETGADAQRAADDLVALQKRIAAARKLNESVAQRLASEGPKLSIALQVLARDAAAATIEADAVNMLLPAGERPVLTADFIARGKPALPRQDIGTREASLWVFETTGELVGDQDAVVEMGKNVGALQAGTLGPSVRCVRRRFSLTEFHPAETADFPTPVFEILRIPSFTASSVDFDGGLLGVGDVAAIPIKKAAEKSRRRPVQIEPVPIEPMPDTRSDLARTMQRMAEATQ